MKLDKVKKKLLDERNRLLFETSALDIGNEIGYGEVDTACHLETRNRNKSLAKNNAVIIDRISRALAKIERGSYGECDECSSEIEDRRLVHSPFSTHCLLCAENNEVERKKYARV